MGSTITKKRQTTIPSAAALKGVLSSNKGKDLTFAQIRKAAVSRFRKRSK